MKNIAKALANFHAEMGKISKDETNPFFKNKYASLPTILSAIKESLQKSGLVFTQIPTGDNELETILIEVESGEAIRGTFKMILAKQDSQGQGSAITYTRRYALGAILGLNIDEDDDGNAAIKPTATPKPAAAPKTNAIGLLKIKLSNMGAKNEAEALKLIEDKAGVRIKSLKEIDNEAAKELINLIA